MIKSRTHSRIAFFFTVLVLTLVSSLLSSCASVPTPDKGEGTLFALPVLYFSTAPKDLQTNIHYIMTIYSIDTDKTYTVQIPPHKGKDYIMVSSLPEGRYRITEYDSKGFQEDFQNKLKDSQDFQVVKGKITLSPYKFVNRIDENPKTKLHTYYSDLMIIDEKQQARMMNHLRGTGEWAPWFTE